MPLAAAEAFSKLHPDSPFTFVHVSGEGATQTPSMFTPIFGRVKGQIETALVDLSKQRLQRAPWRCGLERTARDPRLHPAAAGVEKVDACAAQCRLEGADDAD
jgi:hypothetical protein